MSEEPPWEKYRELSDWDFETKEARRRDPREVAHENLRKELNEIGKDLFARKRQNKKMDDPIFKAGLFSPKIKKTSSGEIYEKVRGFYIKKEQVDILRTFPGKIIGSHMEEFNEKDIEGINEIYYFLDLSDPLGRTSVGFSRGNVAYLDLRGRFWRFSYQKALEQLKSLPNLEVLILNDFLSNLEYRTRIEKVTNKVIDTISTLNELKYLNIFNAHISPESFLKLVKLPNLRFFGAHCYGFGASEIKDFVNAYVKERQSNKKEINLTIDLSFGGRYKISDKGFEVVDAEINKFG